MAPGWKEAHRQRVNVEDEEMEGHGQADGAHQPDIHPWWHPQEGLVLRQAAWGRPGRAKGGRHKEKAVVRRVEDRLWRPESTAGGCTGPTC